MFHLAAHKANQCIRYGAQSYNQGMEQPGGNAHRCNKNASPTNWILHCGSFWCNLAENQDNQGDEDCSNQFTIVWKKAERYHGSHAGGNDHSNAVNDQNGREENIWVSDQM